MTSTYPQETVGTTLLCVNDNGEFRRVYTRKRKRYLEVGEFTRGIVTQGIYQSPAHLHAIHLPLDFPEEELLEFFKEGDPFLADYMDALDIEGLTYGYLNGAENQYVSFRPARPKV